MIIQSNNVFSMSLHAPGHKHFDRERQCVGRGGDGRQLDATALRSRQEEHAGGTTTYRCRWSRDRDFSINNGNKTLSFNSLTPR